MALLLGNDQVVELSGLRDPITGDYLNSATVELTIKDYAGEAVAGETWPLALAYVADSDGIYRGVKSADVQLTEGARYWLELRVASGNLDGFWRWSLPARYRVPGD